MGRPPKENKKDVPLEESLSGIIDNDSDENKEKVNHDKDDGYGVQIVRDWYGKVDVTHLSNKDPNYEYRFLRDEHKNLSQKTNNMLFQKGGWQLVPREHLLKIGIEERDISGDGLHRRGDLVLARMPKDLFKEKEEYKQKKANDPVDAVTRMINEGDPNTGGKEIHESMRGIQTQEQLGIK